MKPQIAGLAWYKREHYKELLTIFEDADKLPLTYDKWLGKATAAEKGFKLRGIKVVRAYINPQDFPEWCRAEGHNVDAKARMKFANLAAYRSTQGSH